MNQYEVHKSVFVFQSYEKNTIFAYANRYRPEQQVKKPSYIVLCINPFV